MPTTYLISDAHEWAHEHGLCDRFGKFDNNVHQTSGAYVPELACDDLLAEQSAFTMLSEAEDSGETQAAYGVTFPDGSALFWTDDYWGVTDGDLIDSTRLWRLIAI